MIATLKTAWRVPVLSVVLIGLVCLGFGTDSENPIVQTYTDPMLLEFLVGTWIGLCMTQIRKIPGYVGVLLIAVSLFLLVVLHGALPMSWRALSFGLPASLMLIGALALKTNVPTSPLGKFGHAIGDSSYSLYLWHGMAISVTSKIASRLELPVFAEIALAVIGGLAVGFASYWLIESPIRRWSAEMRAKKPPPPAAA